MSRAIRRQQKAAESKQTSSTASTRGMGLSRPRAVRGGAKPAATPGRRRLRAPAWTQDIVSELKKVTWPTREETVYLTTVVIIVAVSVGIVLGGIDLFFNWLIDRILLR